MKHEFESLLHKKMDRRDFLKHVAVGLLIISGISGLIKTLSGLNSTSQKGYGKGAYGR